MSSGLGNGSKWVIKIGGSLLQRPDLATALTTWLDRRLGDHRHRTQLNFVVGGGGLIDAFRQLDAVHPIDPVWLHWECVAALRHTSRFVAQILPNAVLIDTPESFQRHRRSTNCTQRFVVVPDTFYYPASDHKLPCDWTTTSDSMAALLANMIAADQLVLLKSCEVPVGHDLYELSQRGIVDPVLCQIVDGVDVEVIRLPP